MQYLSAIMIVGSVIACEKKTNGSTISKISNNITSYQESCNDSNAFQKALLSPNEELKIACVANPTLYYNAEHYWTLSLIEKMIATGNYTTLYLDIPVVEAMMFDDYVKGNNNVTMNTIIDNYNFNIDDRLYMRQEDLLYLLANIKGYNMSSDRNVSVIGLWYNVDEIEVEVFSRVYKQHTVICNFLSKSREAFTEEQIKEIGQDFEKYLQKNEKTIRKEESSKYDLYIRIAHSMKQQLCDDDLVTYDKRMFENFLYLESHNTPNSKAILLLGPYQMKHEKNKCSFRELMEHQFTSSQYLIYNILEESRNLRRVESPIPNSSVLSEIQLIYDKMYGRKK